MRMEVDEDLCTGCGTCEEICPEVFSMRGDLEVVLEDPVQPAQEESALEALESCPVDAILEAEE